MPSPTSLARRQPVANMAGLAVKLSAKPNGSFSRSGETGSSSCGTGWPGTPKLHVRAIARHEQRSAAIAVQCLKDALPLRVVRVPKSPKRSRRSAMGRLARTPVDRSVDAHTPSMFDSQWTRNRAGHTGGIVSRAARTDRMPPSYLPSKRWPAPRSAWQTGSLGRVGYKRPSAWPPDPPRQGPLLARPAVARRRQAPCPRTGRIAGAGEDRLRDPAPPRGRRPPRRRPAAARPAIDRASHAEERQGTGKSASSRVQRCARARSEVLAVRHQPRRSRSRRMSSPPGAPVPRYRCSSSTTRNIRLGRST